jgi:hypothetical protein
LAQNGRSSDTASTLVARIIVHDVDSSFLGESERYGRDINEYCQCQVLLDEFGSDSRQLMKRKTTWNSSVFANLYHVAPTLLWLPRPRTKDSSTNTATRTILPNPHSWRGDVCIARGDAFFDLVVNAGLGESRGGRGEARALFGEFVGLALGFAG